MIPRSASLCTVLVLALAHAPALAEDRIESIFRDTRGYTVRIRTQINTPFIEDETGSFFGAGFLIDSERRWVLTNAHVVGQCPSEVQVAFADGSFHPARKLYVDSFTDMAVLELPVEAGRHPAAVCDCEREPRVGEGVGVFGHPKGYDFTGTRGIISGKSDREIVDLLQTDATIDHGNSGGPMIALRDGKIIGIASSGYLKDKEDKVNFATPMKDVCRIVSLLRSGVAPEPPQIGFGLMIDERGSHTLRIGATSDEARWPFRPGDRIEAVGRPGQVVRTPHELVTALRGRTGAVPVRVLRDGREVVVQTHPSYRASIVARRGVVIDGALIAPLAYEDSTVLRHSASLVVHSVDTGSAAEAVDLESADNVVTIDGRTFEGLDDLIAYLGDRKKGTPLKLVLTRLSPSHNRWFDYHVRELPGEDYEVVGAGSELSAEAKAAD